jgi:serine/threonine protein kinase
VQISKLGRYEIVAELGKGAMGVVYKATDPMLNRVVAIKTINMSLDQGEMAEYEARFYQEARAAGGLNHPNIVTIYDIGKSGNVAYMAMEVLEGRELRALMMPGRPQPVAQAVDIAIQVAEGLGYAHHHEVVHRDIKPANIMIVRGGLVKITDFGIARMRSAEVQTQSGVLLGSPRYMSPEQVLGKRAEPRSDLFSLGVILYEMLTGKTPFTGEDINSMMFQILNLTPPAPSSMNPQVPEMLDLIVARALAKSPDQRYQDAHALAADLKDCRKRLETAAPPPSLATTDKQLAHPVIDAEGATQLMKRSFPHGRRTDAEPGAIEPVPTAELSKAFDSLAATMRLAAKTGMANELKNYADTQKRKSLDNTIVRGTVVGTAAFDRRSPLQRQEREGWSRRDKLVFAASVAAALVIAALIVLH